jgi:hypothetical protein
MIADLRTDHAYTGILGKRLQQPFNQIRHHFRVIVDEQKVIAACSIDPSIITAGETEIGSVADQSYFRIAGLDDGRGVLLRSIVNHDDLIVRIIEAPRRINELAGNLQLIIVNYNDGYQWILCFQIAVSLSRSLAEWDLVAGPLVACFGHRFPSLLKPLVANTDASKSAKRYAFPGCCAHRSPDG